MKVAINASYGGFGLSPEALKLYCEKAGISCYFFKYEYTTEPTLRSKLVPAYDLTDHGKYSRDNLAFSIPNPQEQKNPHDYRIGDGFTDDRTNKFLIEAIEELGSEAASGSSCKIKIVEVPDDVKWHIAVYDGWEWVAEDHRKWE